MNVKWKFFLNGLVECVEPIRAVEEFALCYGTSYRVQINKQSLSGPDELSFCFSEFSLCVVECEIFGRQISRRDAGETGVRVLGHNDV